MPNGNRMLIVILALLALAFAGAAFVLEYYGKGDGAVFTGLATLCLGILSPSPIKHQEGPNP